MFLSKPRITSNNKLLISAPLKNFVIIHRFQNCHQLNIYRQRVFVWKPAGLSFKHNFYNLSSRPYAPLGAIRTNDDDDDLHLRKSALQNGTSFIGYGLCSR